MEQQAQVEVPEEKIIQAVVEELCRPDSYEVVYHRPTLEGVMPSLEVLTEIVERLRMVLFPAYFSDSEMAPATMPYIVGSHLERVERLLAEQIKRGFGFSCEKTDRASCIECEDRSKLLSRKFIATVPKIRRLLATDVMAAFEGDPAAKSTSETIFCYPSIKTMTNFRIAHELYLLGVEIIPRIITEMAHSATGIDIHPGAAIGERFFIDHGTGTVIGETCEIGRNVRLYQGVTLGAKSFPKDDAGRLVKGIPRHPIVEDDVIIYSGTTILGRVRIGRGSVIGGNVWLDHDVEPGTTVLQSESAGNIVMCPNGKD
ncbi:MAG TPA: serine acetyltransferase [Deltaproteobacteria bacterium]|nr:serine acetyltransferase [Deltaproteobacteria bacterium]HPR54911.1 serine acetyltransferase [Deltaproteobacteria bacterium]HXK48234.1 serine acetyltransferase [Deltaproteobacteria bacterium]